MATERKPLLSHPAGDAEAGRRRAGEWCKAALLQRAPLLVIATIVSAISAAAALMLASTMEGGETALVREQRTTSRDRHRTEALLVRQAALKVLTGGGREQTEMLLQSDIGLPCKEHWNCQPWLVCSKGLCAACETNLQCQQRHPARQCFSNISWAVEDQYEFNVCKHKPLFFPFTWQDFVLIWITFLTIALSAPTGTGGGGILVPMYMIIGDFSAHSAVPLSKATIVGGAIANNMINIQRRHPFANRPVIDFDALQLLVPNLLAGTIMGVFFNAISPDWLITIGLVIALGYSGLSAAKKGWSLYAEESRVEAAAEARPLMGSTMPAQHYSFETKDNLPSALHDIVEAESKVNFKALGVVLVSWFLVFVCSLLKGGSGSKSVVPCGSIEFFVLAFLPIPIILILSWRIGLEVNARFQRKKEATFRFADGDPLWNLENVRFYSFIALFVGIGAGALGIAAGTLLSPLLLSAGMNPIVTVATTGMMVLFTSSATTVQYLMLGRLQLDYASFFIVVGVFAAALGNTLIHWVVRKYRQTWFVVAILATVILLSTVLLGYLGFYRTLRSWLQGEDMGFHDICNDRSHMLNEGQDEDSQDGHHWLAWFANPLDWL